MVYFKDLFGVTFSVGIVSFSNGCMLRIRTETPIPALRKGGGYWVQEEESDKEEMADCVSWVHRGPGE